MAMQDVETFYQRFSHRLEQQYTMGEGALKKYLGVLAKHIQEIDEILMNLCTDKVNGILTEQLFLRMTETLDQEQAITRPGCR